MRDGKRWLREIDELHNAQQELFKEAWKRYSLPGSIGCVEFGVVHVLSIPTAQLRVACTIVRGSERFVVPKTTSEDLRKIADVMFGYEQWIRGELAELPEEDAP